MNERKYIFGNIKIENEAFKKATLIISNCAAVLFERRFFFHRRTLVRNLGYISPKFTGGDAFDSPDPGLFSASSRVKFGEV